MMSAYNESYVSGAQRRLGAMVDTAVNDFDCSLDAFYGAFVESPLSRRFGAGDPAIIAGRSGEELAFEILDKQLPRNLSPSTWVQRSAATPEYWTGWALAFYQWASGFSFKEIQQLVSASQVLSMYRPFHEMDIRQFCDKMDELCAQKRPLANLQRIRLAAGLSQNQLAAASGVPVRTLQQYEQRQKNINRARADYVEALARVLCCSISDLLERRASCSVEYTAIRM